MNRRMIGCAHVAALSLVMMMSSCGDGGSTVQATTTTVPRTAATAVHHRRAGHPRSVCQVLIRALASVGLRARTSTARGLSLYREYTPGGIS